MAIKTVAVTLPLIYCYSTPDIPYHDGWVKIGYTEQTVEQRNKYLNTGGIRWVDEWHEFAVFTDGSNIPFTDDDFRAYLLSKGVNNKNTFGENGEPLGDEWYEISSEKAKEYFDEYRKSPSATKVLRAYKLREEQKKAVKDTKILADNNVTEVLWNAKPRFGKCLSCYDFCKEMKAKNILIVTNRPAVAMSWYDDYRKYIGRKDGYYFVSHVSDIIEDVKNDKDGKNKAVDYKEFAAIRDRLAQNPVEDAIEPKLIYFVSLQDIKGSQYFGTGGYNKLKELTQIEWDVLVVDESHEGVDTYKTEAAFRYINRKFTLYLSGTPFKAIRDEKFDENSIYNWTYVDEQEAKERWNGEGDNPYQIMPKLNMITYRLANIIGGSTLDFSGEENAEQGDDMNELFRFVNGKFVHESDVDKFLNVISSNEKYPFGNEEIRKELRHTFWLMQSVGDRETANVKALARKLREHPLFSQYEIVIAADDGKADDGDESGSHYKRVKKAIENCENGTSGKRGTITLSVKSLTTGVTIPEWSGVMMLSERNSASEYMQASFRPQNPYIFSNTNKVTGETTFYRKTNAYVFDFNPEHTLDIVEEFANNLYSKTANGKGDIAERKANIEQLLKYMSVTGENEDGFMEPLEADMVMLIPRKIRSEEVVRKGFMCDKLFQNITRVFRIMDKGSEIVNGKLPICNDKNPKKSIEPAPPITQEEIDEMHLDENGDVNVTDDFVEQEVNKTITQEEKTAVKEQIAKDIQNVDISAQSKGKEKDAEREAFVKAYTQAAVTKVVEDIKQKNPKVVTKAVENTMKREIAKEARTKANSIYSDYVHDAKLKEDEIRETLGSDATDEEKIIIEQLVQESNEQAAEQLKKTAINSLPAHVQNSYKIADTEKETVKANNLKNDKLDEFKKRLKSFTRTIPSFLMAYGDENFKLENMETYVDPDEFQEVAYITVDEFKVLRDDCQYFDSVVCNDAMQNFLDKRKVLADYFDENNFIMMGGHKIDDIFDLIPPQKTNQIYTPKDVVQQMSDYLVQENPDCFDNPNATFIDLYMKSGLYITEIVKRLFRSPKLKELYPDENKRLQHIFDKQVYGLAPTKIIFKIATNYILGFAKDKGLQINTNHFKELDALPYAQGNIKDENGNVVTLEEKLDKLFG